MGIGFFVLWVLISLVSVYLIRREIKLDQDRREELDALQKRLTELEVKSADGNILKSNPGTRVPEPGERL